MCDPISMTVAATALSAAGTLASGYSAYSQGQATNKIAKQNAQMDERAARDAIARGEEEAQRHYEEVAQLKGDQIASMAANGIDVTFGSAAILQQDTEMLANRDANIILDNAAREAEGFRISAWNARAQGQAAAAQGKMAAANSVLQAGSTIIGGATQVKGMQAKYGNSTGTGQGKAPAWVGAPIGRG